MIAINLHNYEAFLLDYEEKKLSSAQLDALKLFIKKNPQLNINLNEISFNTLNPINLTFTSKDNLKQHAVAQQIVANIDNEFSINEKIELEQLINNTPKFKTLQKEYEKTILYPIAISYPNKEALKQKERSIIPIFWKMAAAILILLFSLFQFWDSHLVSKKTTTSMAEIKKEKTAPTVQFSTNLSSAVAKIETKNNHQKNINKNSNQIIKEEEDRSANITQNSKKMATQVIINNTNLTIENKDTSTYKIIEPFIDENLIVIEPANMEALFAEKIEIEPSNPFLTSEKKIKNPFLIQVAEKIINEDIVYINEKNQVGKTESYALQVGTISLSKN